MTPATVTVLDIVLVVAHEATRETNDRGGLAFLVDDGVSHGPTLEPSPLVSKDLFGQFSGACKKEDFHGADPDVAYHHWRLAP